MELIRAKVSEDFRQKKEIEDSYIEAYGEIKLENEDEKQLII
jgi:hypothetical protein